MDQQSVNLGKGVVALLVLIITLVYLPSWNQGFVIWDDMTYIVGNPVVNQWWDAPWDVRLMTPFVGYPVALPVAIQALAISLFGDVAAGVLHAFSTLIHITNALVLISLLRRFQLRGGELLAACWALHPIVVEGVAWATNLKEVLVTFAVLSCAFAWDHVLVGDKRWKWGLGLGLVVGFLSKPTFVVVGPILVVLTVVRKGRAVLFEPSKLTFFGALAGFSAFWIYMAETAHSNLNLENMIHRDHPTAIFSAIGLLAKNVIWPNDLQPIYPYLLNQWFDLASLGVFVVLVGLVVGVWAGFRRYTIVLFGLGWLVIAYLPYSNITPLPRWTCDTYAYLPLIGVVIALAPLLDGLLLSKWSKFSLLIVGLLTVTLALHSRPQVERWSSTRALMEPVATDYMNFPTPHQLIAMEDFFLGAYERSAETLRMIWPYQTRIPLPRFAPEVFMKVGDRAWASKALNDWVKREDSDAARAYAEDFKRQHGLP